MYGLSSWRFNNQVSEIFDNHVRQSVPGYDDIQALVCHISDHFVREHEVVYDIGCSTGETIYNINQRHADKKLRFIGIDNSIPMLEKAVKKNNNNKNMYFINSNIEKYSFDLKSNLIIAILSIQFAPLEDRESVIRKIYEALYIGGAFVYVEKTFADNSKMQDIFTQTYHDFKEEHGLSAKDIRDKDKSLRGVLVPMHVHENIQMLQQTGFTVDVFYKNLNFTGFLAIK